MTKKAVKNITKIIGKVASKLYTLAIRGLILAIIAIIERYSFWLNLTRYALNFYPFMVSLE